MKLAKLSLATIVAVGAMTTIASATPLEEAIKGVELNGFIRYRYYNNSDWVYNNDNNERNRFSAPFSFTIPVAENLKAGVTLRYEGNDYTNNNGIGNGDFSMTKAWFQYAVDGFSFKMGKFEILSPWTDSGYAGNRGDGGIIFYTGVPGWTFAAAGFMGTNAEITVGNNGMALLANTLAASANAGEAHAGALLGALNDGVDVGQENLYAVAALGAVGPVNLQLWAASMEHVFDYSVFGQAEFKMAGFSFLAQANNLKLSDEMDDLLVDGGLLGDDSGLFWGVKAGFEMAGFSADIGYTQNDEDQPVYTLSADDTHMIKFGKQLYYETTNVPDASVMFIDLGYKVGKFGLGAGYGHSEVDSDDFADEWYAQVDYKYSKNFKMQLYYSGIDMDADRIEDNNLIRFEAKYSF